VSAAWEAVRGAIDAENAVAVAALVAGFGEVERREVARELPGHLPVARRLGTEKDRERETEWEQGRQTRLAEHRREAERQGWDEYHASYTWDVSERWTRRLESRWIEPMRVAGAGTIAGAAAVVSWLNRRDFERWRSDEVDDVAPILQAISGRPAEWQADLAVRVALRLRGLRPEVGQTIRLALDLLRLTGAEPPAHDPLTAAWIAAMPTPTAARLGEDPLFNTMLPRLFEAEGVGRALRDEDAWPAALCALAQEGRVGREVLLDGCLSRFLRGGSAADLRFFVRLHEQLDPAEEVAARRRDYLRLLPAAPANVADLALKQLRRLGPLQPEEMSEAAEALLFRAEGRLVRVGLAWFDRLVRDHQGDLDGYAPALTTVFGCTSAEARAHAVRLAVKHAGRFTPPGAEMIRDAVALLPAEEGALLAAAFGGEVVPAEPDPDPFTPQPLRPAPEPARMPSPILDPAALTRCRWSEYDWRSAERWLDGFVRLAAYDRAALIGTLAPASGDAARRKDGRNAL
jgi:hypothetical protein